MTFQGQSFLVLRWIGIIAKVVMFSLKIVWGQKLVCVLEEGEYLGTGQSLSLVFGNLSLGRRKTHMRALHPESVEATVRCDEPGWERAENEAFAEVGGGVKSAGCRVNTVFNGIQL
jgi:hypothetical protein